MQNEAHTLVRCRMLSGIKRLQQNSPDSSSRIASLVRSPALSNISRTQSRDHKVIPEWITRREISFQGIEMERATGGRLSSRMWRYYVEGSSHAPSYWLMVMLLRLLTALFPCKVVKAHRICIASLCSVGNAFSRSTRKAAATQRPNSDRPQCLKRERKVLCCGTYPVEKNATGVYDGLSRVTENSTESPVGKETILENQSAAETASTAL